MEKDNRPEWFKLFRGNRRFVDNGLLSLESCGKILINIHRYFDGDELLPLSPVEQMAFIAYQANIDKAFQDFAELSEINSENGRKGGRPSKAIDPDTIEALYKELGSLKAVAASLNVDIKTVKKYWDR